LGGDTLAFRGGGGGPNSTLVLYVNYNPFEVPVRRVKVKISYSGNDDIYILPLFAQVADPPRFSCGVTGDEIKVSGVIVYDECAVNANNMMNLVSASA
jgi:hypothetical protein